MVIIKFSKPAATASVCSNQQISFQKNVISTADSAGTRINYKLNISFESYTPLCAYPIKFQQTLATLSETPIQGNLYGSLIEKEIYLSPLTVPKLINSYSLYKNGGCTNLFAHRFSS